MVTKLFGLFLLLALSITNGQVNGRTVLENQIRSRLAALTPPATCTAGALYINTIGNLYVCTSTNVWVSRGVTWGANVDAGGFNLSNIGTLGVTTMTATTGTISTLNSTTGIITGLTTGAINISGTNPNVTLAKTDAPADQKNWVVQQADGLLQVYMVNDLGAAAQIVFQITRTGAIPDTNAIKMWVDGSLKQVSVGAADSGGAGFKVLRVPN